MLPVYLVSNRNAPAHRNPALSKKKRASHTGRGDGAVSESCSKEAQDPHKQNVTQANAYRRRERSGFTTHASGSE